MLAIIPLVILVVIFCGCDSDEEEEQAEDTPGEVDRARTITGKDGAEMVLIPAGEFQMGTDPDEIPALVQQHEQSGVVALDFENETPRRAVYVDAFYMDIYEVTNAQYKKFMDATGHYPPLYWDDSLYNAPNQPVVGVFWYEAVAYAKWAGKRLPTEAEWEKAARGGLVGKKYPWGDSEPNGTQCNFADRNTDFKLSDKSVDDGYEYSAPVGSYPANGYGLYDMAGNAWEWCTDRYDEEYYVNSPRWDQKGTDSESFLVLRGGSWRHFAFILRAAHSFRHHKLDPSWTWLTNGFRCVVVSQD
jgi:iron(II)-dependent oxidoreductase